MWPHSYPSTIHSNASDPPHLSLDSQGPTDSIAPKKPVTTAQDATSFATTLPSENQVITIQLESKEICIELIGNHDSFGELSTNLWTHLSQADHTTPDGLKINSIAEEIKQFQTKNQTYIDILNKTPWKQRIAELSKKIENPPTDLKYKEEWSALERFRTEFVELQNKLAGQAARIMGIVHDSSDWGRFGTPGNKSDIDNVYSPKENTAETDQMLIKILADTFYTYVMGPDSLSGIQLDVETYIAHPGKTQNTETKISPSSRGKLYHLELTMAQLQMRNAYGHDHQGWEAYKLNCLSFHTHQDLQHALMEIFTNVEQLHANIQIDILKEMVQQNSHLSSQFDKAFKDVDTAFESGQVEIFGEKIDTLRKAIEQAVNQYSPHSFDKAYKQASMTYKCSRLVTLSQGMDEDRQSLTSQLELSEAEKDKIYIRLEKRALLRNVFFDESYLTAGAYNIICEREGGQLSKREDENNVKFIEQNRRFQTLSGPDLLRIKKEKRDPGTELDLVSSISENSAQFHHIAFSQKEDLIKASIDSSKYAERTTSSSLELLGRMKKETNDSSMKMRLDKEITEVKRLHTITTALEKRKRQTELDDLTTQKLLEDVLIDPLYTNEKKDEIKKNIDSTLQMFQQGGRYFGEEIAPVDKFNLLVSQLTAKGCIKPQPKTIHSFSRLPIEISSALNKMEKLTPPIWAYRNLDRDSQIDLLMAAEQTLRDNQRDFSVSDIVKEARRIIKQKEDLSTPAHWEKSAWFEKESIPMMTTGNKKLDALLRARAGFPRMEDARVQELHTLAKGSEMMGIAGLNTPEEINKYFKDMETIQHTLIKLTHDTQLLPPPIKDNKGEENADREDLVHLWQLTRSNAPNLGE